MAMESIVAEIVRLISEHGIMAVMAGMILEEVFVPLPSPIVPMAAGALLVKSSQLMPAMFEIFFYIALPASIASVISSYFVYSIAYFGGKPAIQRYGKWFDLRWKDIQKLERHFDSGNEKYYVALFRAIPVVPLSLISGSAGLFRMNWKQYGIWSFIGMLPRNFGLALIGWWVKDRFVLLASRIDALSTWVLLLIVGTAVGFILYRNLEDLGHYIARKL